MESVEMKEEANSNGSEKAVLRDLLQFKKDFSLGNCCGVNNGDNSTRSYSESSATNGSSTLSRDDSMKSLLEFQKSFKLCSKQEGEEEINSGDHMVDSTNGNDSSSTCTTTATTMAREVPKTLDISSLKLPNTRQVKKKKRRTKTRLEDDFTDVYQLTTDVLGTGARSTVVTCIKKTTGKEYAVKIVHNTCSEVRDRVLKEVEILYSCSASSNFLQIEDFFETNENFYLVFEKMAGPLLELIQKRERFTEKEASHVTREVAMALAFLHKQGIAHRDLKPENILCERVDQAVPIKVCDFDLSSMQTPSTTPNLFTPVGSAEFMAPEVLDTFTGEIFSYDKKCDLWSLGVLIYMMLSGRPPFYGKCSKDCGWDRGESCEECQAMLLERITKGQYSFPSDIWSTISSEGKDLISRLLERDVGKRLSAVDVLKHPWLENDDVPDTPLQTPGMLRRNPSIPEELSLYAASCLKCTRRLSTHFEKVPFTLSPPGSSDLALRRERKCS